MIASIILRNAANIIDKKGLHQGGSMGGECILTSIDKIVPLHTSLFNDTTYSLANFLGLPAQCCNTYLMRWNDIQGRTKKEVVQAMRDCADKLESVSGF